VVAQTEESTLEGCGVGILLLACKSGGHCDAPPRRPDHHAREDLQRHAADAHVQVRERQRR